MRTRNIVLLAVSIVFFSILLPFLLVAIRSHVSRFSMDDYTILYTTQFLAYVISFLIFPKTFKYVATEINLAALKQVKTYIYMGVAFFITFVVHLLMNSDVINIEYSDWQPSVWIVLLLVILIPLFEEILFRGVLYKFLFIKKGKVAAIVLTTLLFAIMHNDNFLFYFCGDLFITIVRYKTSSLASSYILHVLWNLYAVFLI
ncbi:CAAX amino protease [Paenibacillus montaniterrae]|uniref:CAAX amino protease n=1 Tax=Paenibacillus montaniterrae TaxID=429341 RepID=A0A919YWR2_9BACL|nr:type II CAAX endopeptidase family protein [Paenibacillus montaniterrae]GIP18671.1 CAAX amino protease [Paenibacillus montaniterrae]